MRPPDGQARGKRVFDSHGSEVEVAYFGVDGKPAAIPEGYARIVRAYDDRGNVTEEAYFGPDGKRALARTGFARVRRAYDDAGELQNVSYFDAGDRPTRLDFIRNWLVLAPLPLPAGQSPESAVGHQLLPDEAELRPREGDRVRVGGTHLIWKKHRAPEYFLDFNRVVGRPTDYSAGYAVCYLVADRERKDLVLKLGSDDQVAVRLNGRELLCVNRPRALAIDDDILSNVTLKAGTNVLVLQVVNETRDWAACVRLTDGDGRPVPGVEVTLSPP
jgi:hypothetical protein